MRALVGLHLRMLRRSLVYLPGSVVGPAIWIFGMEGAGDVPRGLTAATLLGVVTVAILQASMLRPWLKVLPVRGRHDLAASALVLSGGFAVLALGFVALAPGEAPFAKWGNTVLLGGIGILFGAWLGRRLRATLGSVLLVMLSGGIVYALLSRCGDEAATPWLALALLALSAVLFGAEGPTQMIDSRPAGRPGRSSPSPGRGPLVALLRLAWRTPLSSSWAVLLLFLSLVFPLTGEPGALGAIFVAAMGPLILEIGLDGYRGLFAVPLSRRSAFLVFLLPAWGFVALCLFLRGAAAIAAGEAAVGAVAETCLLLVLATVVFRLQLSRGRGFAIALGAIVLLGTVPFLFPTWLGSTSGWWRFLLSDGGRAGAFAVAGAVASAVLFHDLRRAFLRLEWTDLPVVTGSGS